MSKMMQILRSSDLETRERRVEKLKRELEDLNVTLEINVEALERMKSRQ